MSDSSMIPSSENPLVNAARAIAVSAYPDARHHVPGGKAERYSLALIAYIFRIQRLMGDLDKMPFWVVNFRADSMQRHLNTGYRNLMRAFTIRDVIYSALNMTQQRDNYVRGESSTFLINYTPDLTGAKIEMPILETSAGYILLGRVPDTKVASLRAAILYHAPAMSKFQGPAVKADGRDAEGDYQNVYNRYVRPSFFVQHIVQEVWERASECLDEAEERGLPIDQLLMRKAVWASDIHSKTEKGLVPALFIAKKLGISSSLDDFVRFAEPTPDS